LKYQTSPESRLLTSEIVVEYRARLEKCVRIRAVHASETRGKARNRRGGPGYTPAPLSNLRLLRRPRRCLPRPCSKPGAPRLDGLCRRHADLTMTQCALAAGHIRLAAARAVYVQVGSSLGVCALSLTDISAARSFSIFASYPIAAPVLSCAGLVVSVLHSRASALTDLPAQQPAARAIAHCKLIKALVATILFALSLYTEIAFVEGKSVLVLAALIGPTVRQRPPSPRPRRLTAHASVRRRPVYPLHLLAALHATVPPTRATAILLALLASYLYRDVWLLLTPSLQLLNARRRSTCVRLILSRTAAA
jgi:hypothetical protein